MFTNELDTNGEHELTHPQQRIWMMEATYPGTSIGNLNAALKFEQRLDVTVLEKAVQALIASYDIFQLRLHVRASGEVYQSFMQQPELKPVDVVQFSQDTEQSVIDAWIREQGKIPFQLIGSELYYFCIILKGEDETWVYMKSHHIIQDGFSLSKCGLEVYRLYQELLHGEAPQIPLPYSYQAYIEEEKKYLQSGRFAKDRKYWLEKFQTVPDSSTIKPNLAPAINTHAARFSYSLSKLLSEQINHYGQEHQVSPSSLLLSALSILLFKLTSNQDIVVGTNYLNRTNFNDKHALGMFVSTTPLRMTLEPEMTFRELVSQAGQEQLSTLRHHKYPYDLLLSEIRKSHPHVNRLFQLSMDYLDMGQAEEAGSQLGNSEDYGCEDLTLDAVFHLHNMPGNLLLKIDYRTSLFTEEEIRQICDRLMLIMEQGMKSPGQMLKDFDIVTKEEKHKLLVDFNDTSFPVRDITVHQCFEEQANRFPDRTAVAFQGQSMTYRQLNERANQLAHTLRNRGVKAGQPVGILAERSMEMITGLLAILKAGGAYVPFDPEYPQERMSYMIGDSGIKLMLLQKHLSAKAAGVEHQVVLDEEISYCEEKTNLPDVNQPGDLMYIMYTSGTTGAPKGVLITHRNVTSLIQGATEFQITEQDRVLQLSSYAFDGSTFDIYNALLRGAALILVPKETMRDIAQITDLIKNEQITVSFMTTALFNLFIDCDLSSLKNMKAIFFGGEQVSVSHVRKALDMLGAGRLYHIYGPTECTVYAAYWKINSIDPEAATLPIGSPISNTQMYIVNGDRQLQPIGVPGELCIGGAGLSQGYLNQADLTNEVFVNHPFAAGELIYRTGDLAKWLPDGTIEYVGRLDHQVKIRGFRIELGEIDAQLAKVPSIKQSVVVVREDEAGEKQLCGYYVADRTFGAGELRDILSQSLPRFMIPTRFVQLHEMPLTPNGKIDRKALPKPSERAHYTGTEYAEPQTELEQKLAAVWSEVLENVNIGIDDDFVELGGHSLLALKLEVELQKHFDIDHFDLQECNTIRKLAVYIEDKLAVAVGGGEYNNV